MNFDSSKTHSILIRTFSALEASLLTSGLNQGEIEQLRTESIEHMAADIPPLQDLTIAMELSKRDEEARLNRLRQEEEELEKVLKMELISF